ncbi:MAG: amidohydrolase family protein [Clostridiales Family XIII bacterium]|jgi:predicted TIM-barrel fold metal-dependent hydrolase|nr:amidohydrolase family protein [Clostridiales Family XIII bacterium]
MNIDVHVHPDFYERICGDAELVALRRHSLHILQSAVKPIETVFLQMRNAEIDKSCLLARDYSASDGRPAVSNEEVAAIRDMYPDRFFAFASIDPSDPNHLASLEYAYAELRLSGLKLHPGRQRFYPADRRMDKIYEMCVAYDKPILFHSGLSFEPDCLSEYARPPHFEETASRFPKLRFCLAHFGWPWLRETAMLMLKYPNVYADTAMLYFDSAREFLETSLTKDIPRTWIDRSLRRQVLFGSDYPRFEQMRMSAAIAQLGFRDSTVELIRGGNAAEFLAE